MPEGRLERTRRATRFREQDEMREKDYRANADHYFAGLSRWYASRVLFTTDRDLGDETTT